MDLSDLAIPMSNGAGAPADERGEFRLDLRSIVGILLRHWKLVLAGPLVSIAITYSILAIIPPLYKSSVEILVADPKRPTNAAEGKQLSMLDVDSAAIESEIEVLGSQAVALRAVEALHLDKDPEFIQPGGFAAVLRRLGLGGRAAPAAGGEETRLEIAAAALRKQLTVERVQFSYALQLSVTSVDPRKARRIAREVAAAYLADQEAARQRAISEGSAWLGGRLAALRARVLDNEAAIQKLKAANGLSDVGTGGNVSQQQTSDLNNQLILARADVAEKRARYEQARQVLKSGGNVQAIPDMLASPVIAQLREQQSKVSRKEADLASRFGPAYPELIVARSQLKDIEKGINAEVARILDNLKNAYQVAEQREQSLEGSLNHVTQRHGDSPAVVKLGDLERLDASDRRLYESFLANFNSIAARASLNDSTARVITPASLPTAPAFPRSHLILALMFAVGGFAGIALAFIVDHLAGGFKTSAQAEAALRAPVLGLIFDMPRRGLLRPRGADILAEIIAKPASRLAEAVRTTRIGLALSGGGSAKVILVTSSIPGEGKTTTAMLLATSAALSGQRALLVDGDLRSRSASRTIGGGLRPGLTEVLEGRIELDRAIVTEAPSGLALLSAGTSKLNPADLLNSPRASELIGELRQRFDLIVLDATPLLPVVDAAILARLADRIVFVVRWGHTPRTSAMEAMKALGSEAQGRIGVVLNRVNLKRLRSYGYGYGHGYNYGHAYGKLGKYYE
ncbi:MAG TPA: polysaccharide biosynthesis tyrosine autokinase [Stellaceae bacterium]|nr:polysaccharide biosynthesis tyrosine autokinase [Stellaceae bacterium]